MNWKITRDTASAPWKLADAKSGEELDNAKVAAVATLFSAASFADVLPPDAPESDTGMDKPSTVRIETFDNFVYELQIGKLMGENYPVLISVNAEAPKERTPAADEKPEDKAKLDQEFQTKQKQLTDKFTAEQKLQIWPFLIPKGTIEQLLKDRASLMAEKKPSPSPTSAVAIPGAPKSSPAVKTPAITPHPGLSPAKPRTSPAKRK